MPARMPVGTRSSGWPWRARPHVGLHLGDGEEHVGVDAGHRAGLERERDQAGRCVGEVRAGAGRARAAERVQGVREDDEGEDAGGCDEERGWRLGGRSGKGVHERWSRIGGRCYIATRSVRLRPAVQEGTLCSRMSVALPPSYEAFYLPGPADLDTNEAVKVGLAWLRRQPGQPLILLHAKRMVGNNRTLAEAVHRYRIPVEAPRTVWDHPWSGGSILAPWASDRVLRCIDDDLRDRAMAVCVIGTLPGRHDLWIAAHRAADLRGGPAREAVVSDPVVRVALDQASRTINHNNGLVQAEDKAYVVLTLQELLRGGHPFDLDEIVAYAMALGWTGDEVTRLREYGQRVLAGRRFRLQSEYGPRVGACKDWEDVARR